MTAKIQSMKEMINKIDAMQIKNVCSVKDLFEKIKKLHVGRKCLQTTYLTKDLHLKCKKEELVLLIFTLFTQFSCRFTEFSTIFQ